MIENEDRYNVLSNRLVEIEETILQLQSERDEIQRCLKDEGDPLEFATTDPEKLFELGQRVRFNGLPKPINAHAAAGWQIVEDMYDRYC